MRLITVALVLPALLGLGGCAVSVSSQTPPVKWTTGFWFWQGSWVDPSWNGEPVDVIYAHAGTIEEEDPRFPFALRTGEKHERWRVYGFLPDRLPAAREYWLVFRCERQGVPDAFAASEVADAVTRLQAAAAARHLPLKGVQLDIDSPTSALREYAGFLREVKKGLPQGLELSITALLDWFRSGTAIGEVIAETDEFVPQFYDVNAREETAIAARVDGARWGPVFNRFGKRFRAGISTIGRGRKVSRPDAPSSPYLRVAWYRDLVPLHLATHPGFRVT